MPVLEEGQTRLADLETICEELVRFGKMSPGEIVAAHGEDPLSLLDGLPDKAGRRPYGKRGATAIRSLVRRLRRADPDLQARCSSGNVLTHYKQYLLSRMQRHRGELDDAFIVRYEKSISRLLKVKTRAATHFLPCTVPESEGLEEYSLGPVRFCRSSPWLVQNAARIKAQAPEFWNDTVDHIRRSPWLAIVTVDRCDRDTSARRAQEAVTAAINILRLYVPPTDAKRIGLATDPTLALTSVALTENKGILSPVHSHAYPPVQRPDWAPFITGEGVHKTMGKALNFMVADFSENETRERFLDALTWFGEAAAEKNENMAIIKAAACVERLTMSKSERERGPTASQRAAALVANYTDEDFGKLGREIQKVYSARSALMHGDSSPRRTRDVSGYAAMFIARRAMVGFIHFIANLKQPVSDASLNAHYKAMVRQFEQG